MNRQIVAPGGISSEQPAIETWWERESPSEEDTLDWLENQQSVSEGPQRKFLRILCTAFGYSMMAAVFVVLLRVPAR